MVYVSIFQTLDLLLFDQSTHSVQIHILRHIMTVIQNRWIAHPEHRYSSTLPLIQHLIDQTTLD